MNVKVCAYGRWNTRKTLQIATLAETFGRDKVIAISCEGGLGSVESSLLEENIHRVTNFSEFRAVYKLIDERYNSEEFWVCFDGMTEATGWISSEEFNGADNYYEAIAGGKKHQEVASSLKKFGKYISDKSERIDSQKVYGGIGERSKALLSGIKALNCNVYATYLEDLTGSSNREKTVPYGPDVPGKVGLNAVMGSFDVVFRMTYSQDGSKIIAGFKPDCTIYLSRSRDDRAATGKVIPGEIPDFKLGPFVMEYLRSANQGDK